ncbi:ABC transporter permease [Actinomadura barringtoniae]|uniref:ABC transporter permease n=1 Tax=Actinomadura barringtoniae TaxID=1427535 RepID=A0A939PIZ2_9ACTN|nr:ABC transporter permease [Actinomadura barringtoniae]MBO2450049.1 ABC transporter permease [Actinomadura barringtoniae]
MTATTTATAQATPSALTEPARPSLAILTAVEVRKMVDTRAGRWLLILIGLTAVAMMPVILFAADKDDQSLMEFLSASQIGVTLLLPVLGILSITSEWSQRTALSTFCLTPERHRVVIAKLAGGSALAAVFVAVGTVTAVLARTVGAVTGQSGGSWDLPISGLGKMLLLAVIALLSGAAFGMAFMNSPLAIVLYFVLPTVWTTLGQMVHWLKGPAGWLDTNRTLSAIGDANVSAGEWARAGTSLLVWLLIPMVIGLIRLSRREVK